MIRIGVYGAAGYTGGELIRLILGHPSCKLEFATSTTYHGQPVSAIHPDLYGRTDLLFTEEVWRECDVIFLCGGHGRSAELLKRINPARDTTVIDLSSDFRLKRKDHDFVYGLPEVNKSSISAANHIANPGCFATCIQLALLPLADKALLPAEVHITAITGSTGAGQKPVSTTHFSWRDNNVSVYKAFRHQHLDEIMQTLRQVQSGFDGNLHFVPVRGNFSRGILASTYLHCDLIEEETIKLYKSYYRDEPFVHIVPHDLSLKQVVNTNNCFIQLRKYNGILHVVAAIDNLLKGASGQAVQNMNLIFSLPETEGLNLKPSAF